MNSTLSSKYLSPHPVRISRLVRYSAIPAIIYGILEVIQRSFYIFPYPFGFFLGNYNDRSDLAVSLTLVGIAALLSTSKTFWLRMLTFIAAVSGLFFVGRASGIYFTTPVESLLGQAHMWALGLMALALALRVSIQYPWPWQTLMLAGLFINLFILMELFYDATELSSLLPFIDQRALAFVTLALLGVGTLLSSQFQGIMETFNSPFLGGNIARFWLIGMLSMTVLAGLLAAWFGKAYPGTSIALALLVTLGSVVSLAVIQRYSKLLNDIHRQYLRQLKATTRLSRHQEQV